MELHPVALATTIRSPNNWLSSFTYGVSPQPAQAPEKANSGSRNCTPRTSAKFTRARSFIGSASKKAMLARSGSTKGSLLRRLMARVSGCSALYAGQASVHRPHPVQSSTWICRVKRTSGKPRTLIGAERKLPGAPSNRLSS